MHEIPHFIAVVAGCLWGLFLGLLPFAAIAVLILSLFDPKRKGETP